MTRRATPEDVDRIASALPEVELGVSWGDRPTYKVRDKGFLLYRAPHKTAIDPETGEMYDDVLVVWTPSEAEKLALVEDATTPFFTIPHFNGYPGVLVRLSRLGEMGVDVLEEVITEAWACRAPRTLVKKHFGER